MSWSEQLLLRLNQVVPKRRSRPSDEGGYSGAQYGWAIDDLALFEGRVELEGKLVLDAGCGPGGKTVFYAERGARKIIGVDRSPANIEQARAFAQKRGLESIEFQVASLDALPFESNTFELAIMSDVVEHVERSILARVFGEIVRVLQPGARLALYFPPWTSFDASHLYNQIHIPWCQLLFSDQTLFNVLRRIVGDPAGVDGAIAHYKELNRITIREFFELVERSGFEQEYVRLKTIKNVPRSGILAIDQYLTKRVVALLRKRSA